MAIIEIVFPQLKKDLESINGAKEKQPMALKTFRDAGVLGGMQGFMASVNGEDVTSDLREVLLLEWPTASVFHEFIESSTFANFIEEIKPFAEGPPQLNLFETNAGLPLLNSRPVLEILLMSPRNTVSEANILAILDKAQVDVGRADESQALYGSSLNLPQKKIALLRTFESREEQHAAKSAPSHHGIMKELSSLAELTQLVAEIKQIPV
ncbi:hypothetical protein F4677DRAFT_424517 [Hypoxylon crocopeplum]|nr:hypothetical protein F4677DRAFT_424517 [Hypoxylon crocopeplum]